MKNVLYLLLAGLLIAACDNTLFNQLPPATQEGRGTFGCRVNGEVWLPKVDAAFDQKATSNIEYDTSLAITARGNGESVSIWVTGNILESQYVLNSPTFPNGRYYNGNTAFLTQDGYAGELIISKYDTVSQIISGTFWFDAVNVDGDIVQVREGRFDLLYKK